MHPPRPRDISLLARVSLLAGLGTLVSTGCGRQITDRNLAEVRSDMSKKQVESILGQPTSVKTHELTLQTQMKTLQATRYYYEQAGKKVELIFVADKLVGKNGHFEIDGVQATRVAEKANSDQPIPGISATGPMTMHPETDFEEPTTPPETAVTPPEELEPPLPGEEEEPR